MTITATGSRMSTEIARQARLAQDIVRTQVTISTGRRIQAASDDPAATTRIAQIARTQADGTVWRNNIALGSELAAQADGVLSRLADRMAHARSQVLAGASGTATGSDRATYATELRAMAEEVDQMRATRNSLDQPLFATGTPLSLRIDGDVLIAPVDGAATVFAPGGVALSQELTDAADALDSGDATQIATALDRLGTAIVHVSDRQGAQGLRADRLGRLADANAARAIDLAVERSGLEDTDLGSAIATLNSQQLTLEAAQAAFARLNRQSLFDILG